MSDDAYRWGRCETCDCHAVVYRYERFCAPCRREQRNSKPKHDKPAPPKEDEE